MLVFVMPALMILSHSAHPCNSASFPHRNSATDASTSPICQTTDEALPSAFGTTM